MSAALSIVNPEPMVVHFGPASLQMSDEQFFEFCLINRDLRIERTSKGDIIVMPPTGGETGIINSKLNMDFGIWARQDGSGKVFDSSTGFTLANGATRSPDVSWVRNERWESLPQEQRKKFPRLCPDFVAELRSESDSLTSLKSKMQEYLENGAELGWLIDPVERQVHIYRSGSAPEVLNDPRDLSGESVLKGFTLDVQSLWD